VVVVAVVEVVVVVVVFEVNGSLGVEDSVAIVVVIGMEEDLVNDNDFCKDDDVVVVIGKIGLVCNKLLFESSFANRLLLLFDKIGLFF